MLSSANLEFAADAFTEGNKFLTDLFPLEPAQAPTPRSEETDETLNHRAVDVQSEVVAFDKFSAEERMADGNRYYSYVTLEDLPPHGRAFYDLAAKLAGLSSLSLLKAVNMLELQVRRWKRRQNKRASTVRNSRETEDNDVGVAERGNEPSAETGLEP